jgi:8-amino-7-oxononanoate synthase
VPIIDHLPGRTLVVDGHEYLFCSGTSYLGMARNAAFAALVEEGMQHYGTNYSSSRHSNLQLAVFEEAEQLLCAQTGAAAALTVSSGYLAGQMAVRALAQHGHFEYAPGTHPAAWLAEHPAAMNHPNSYDAWSKQLLQRLASTAPEPIVIISNSLDPLRVERYDFSWTAHLPTDRPITLLLDDSHGFGVIGQDGTGIITEVQVPASVRVVVVSSLGKACGIPGGVVLSDPDFVAQLRRSGFFGASSPVVPAYLHAFTRATALYAQARQQLQANVAQFAEAVEPLGLFDFAPDFPVFYTSVNALAPYLEKNGVLISSFAYPTPADPCVTRIVLSSLHTTDDIACVTELVRSFALGTK